MARPDPRAEPESVPPKPEVEASKPSSEPSPPAAPEPVAVVEPEAPAPDRARVVTSNDPRIEAAERALGSGDWKRVAKELGSLDDAGRLPPNLGLLCAIAHNEAAPTDEAAPDAHAIAIRCAAGIFGVPPESRIAVVLAKRLMRKNPVAWRARAAPPARVSILIIAIVLVLGGGLGWVLSSGMVRFNLHF